MFILLSIPALTFIAHYHHDALIIQSSCDTFIYLLHFRKIQLFALLLCYQSFCESSCHFCFQTVDILFGMKPINDFHRGQPLIPFLPLLVYFLLPFFLSVHSGTWRLSIGLSDSQIPTCPLGLSQPVNHSVSQSVGQSSLQSQLYGGKH